MQMDDALAARRAAVPATGTADAAGPGGHRETAWGSALPEDAKAVIYCPAPSVMSSARCQAAGWVLEFAPRARPCIEPLIGWTGSTDTLTQVRLRFPSPETAIGYAERQGCTTRSANQPMFATAIELGSAAAGQPSSIKFRSRWLGPGKRPISRSTSSGPLARPGRRWLEHLSGRYRVT